MKGPYLLLLLTSVCLAEPLKSVIDSIDQGPNQLKMTNNEPHRNFRQRINSINVKKDLDYYMEDEDQIYDRPWRSAALEVDPDEAPIEPPNCNEDLDLPEAFDGNGIRKPVDQIRKHFTRMNESYLVIAPLIARPSSVYRLTVVPFRVEDKSQDIDLRASMTTSEGTELTFAQGKAVEGLSSELMMKLPHTLPGGCLRLRVEGRQGPLVLFVNSTVVHPSSDFLIIAVSMSRAAYSSNQDVDFRVALLTHDLLPYQEPVNVYILDPAGYTVRRWVSRVPHTGMVELSFKTPDLPLNGYWRIRVEAKAQRKDHPFLVTQYFIPRFELMYDVPSFVLASEGSISGEIQAVVTNDGDVFGNMTVQLWVKYPANASDDNYKIAGDPIIYDYIGGTEEFEYPFEMFEGFVETLVGAEVKISVSVMDSFTGMTLDGFIKTRIISGAVSVKFVGKSPVVFRPGMPLTLTVNVAYDDNESLDPEELEQSSLRITGTAGGKQIDPIYIPPLMQENMDSEKYDSLQEYYENNASHTQDDRIYFSRIAQDNLIAREEFILSKEFDHFRKTGIFTFTIQIPVDSQSLTLNAAFVDSEGTPTATRLEGLVNIHPKNRHLHVTSSTQKATVGEFAVFHVRTNFPLRKFHYLILSKGILLHSATEEVPFAGAEGVATLGLAVSKDMFPIMTFVAFHVDQKGQIASDTIKIPIHMKKELIKLKLKLNEHKDHSKRTVEAFVEGAAGTYVGMSCARTMNNEKQTKNRMTPMQITMEALKLEPIPSTIGMVYRRPRNSNKPDSITLLTVGDTEGDSIRTLQQAGLGALSDAIFRSSSSNLGNCEMSLGYIECGDGRCFSLSQVCDGVQNCRDNRDEQMCVNEPFMTVSQYDGVTELEQYLMMRANWYKDLFDAEDGSFAWQSQFIGYRTDEGIKLEIPRTQDMWDIDAFGLHSQYGFQIVEPLEYNSDPPVFIVLEGPNVCRRGEQISIRVAVFNSMPFPQSVLVILPHSEDYKFIHVELKGVVDGYKPRTSFGEHQHLLTDIPGESVHELFLPIALVKQEGMLEIPIRMISQLARDEETWEIEIKPEGAPVRKHTSVLLDLKSRALFYEFLDIPIDESPIISNTILRRFVFGSPNAKLTVSGDVFGPVSDDISVHYEDAFNGRNFKSTDGLAFNFGSTIWTLHYLRLTNQLDLAESVPTFDFLNEQMAGILTRMKDGGFKMWHYSGPSVWLTAWVTQIFNAALLEDWENLIYIDPRIFTDSVNFLLQYQSPVGDFYETEFTNITLDNKYSFKKHYGRNASIGLTAIVATSLKQVLNTLPGKTRVNATQAINKAVNFLERSLTALVDPYDIAITTWALNEMGSSEKEVALSKLWDIKIEQDGFIYWSKDRIRSNQRLFENNQRTFLLPKEPQEGDTGAIEATSYALLVFLKKEGVTIRQERVVNWLLSVKDWDKAFVATSDSIVALQALTEYCYRARVRDVTELNVEVDLSAKNEYSEIVSIEKPFVSAMKTLELPNPWGHVLLTSRGAGQALAQLTMTWGVDVDKYLEKPSREFFALSISEYHHQPRNKSRITTTVCTNWVATDFSPTSHSAMVEVEIPTGYFLHQQELNNFVKTTRKNNVFPEMSDAHITDTLVFFQFKYIPSYQQCFSYDLHRWHPVANLTFTRSASVFELFAPEHFEQIIINSTTLNALDICEVCGSYQCPYCAFYSGIPTLEPSIVLVILVVLVTVKGLFVDNLLFYGRDNPLIYR